MLKILLVPFLFLFVLNAPVKNDVVIHPLTDTIHFPGETHFANVQQLTFGGDNAEAYFSFDGKYIVFQKTNPKQGILCDQIWMGKLPESPGDAFIPKLVSTGTGRTTCSYFYPDGKHILYA